MYEEMAWLLPWSRAELMRLKVSRQGALERNKVGAPQTPNQTDKCQFMRNLL